MITPVLVRLPAEMADVLRLVELEEKDVGEAAGMLSRSPSTVSSQHTRGLARFAREAARLRKEGKIGLF
jgi:DNA-directed RNA polymerase specialized sigma24 family protein